MRSYLTAILGPGTPLKGTRLKRTPARKSTAGRLAPVSADSWNTRRRPRLSWWRPSTRST